MMTIPFSNNTVEKLQLLNYNPMHSFLTAVIFPVFQAAAGFHSFPFYMKII